MLLSLLRMFAAFRALESDLALCREAIESITTEKLLLQDRLDAALADKDRLWAVMQEAMANERDALRSQVNYAVQKAGGGVPYPNAHSLPPAAVPDLQTPGPVGRSGRILPSEAIARRTQQFMEELVKSRTPQNG